MNHDDESEVKMRHDMAKETQASGVWCLLRQGSAWHRWASGTATALLSPCREPASEVKLGPWREGRKQHPQVPEGHF